MALGEKVTQDNWVRMFFSPLLVHTLPQLNVDVFLSPTSGLMIRRGQWQSRAGRWPT